MASEEERAKILAEHKASVDAEEGDEGGKGEGELEADPPAKSAPAPAAAAASSAAAALYDDDVEDDDEADWDGGGDSSEEEDDEGEEAGADPVVLDGTIHLNDEGRVIYSGTWCLQSQLDKERADPLGVKKKHPKFKLKGQEKLKPDSSPLFDVRRPTLAKLSGEGDDAIPSRRTMVFDGFFFEALPEGAEAPKEGSNGDGRHHHHHHGKKIKERDVEVFITTDENDKDRPSEYKISGRGYNDYGPFVLEGTYTVPPPKTAAATAPETNGSAKNDGEEKEDSKHHHHHEDRATVRCNKTYGVGGAAKATRSGAAKRSRRGIADDDDDSFDDDFDERADRKEVSDLCEDAHLSIEELRRKYYGGGGDEGDEEEEEGDGGGKALAVKKRPRIMDESDDDECGF